MVVSSFCLPHSSLTWRVPRLGVHAFHTVLSRKQGLYREVVAELFKRTFCPEHTPLKREFGALVRDGLAAFKNIAF